MTQSLERLRVGVIGCGTVAQIMHLPYLAMQPQLFEIAALSDLSPGLLQALGKQYGVPENRRFTDYRDLLATDVDAVLVLNSGTHGPQCVDAANAGKHILVEKPLCLTLREADEIIAAVERAGVTLMVAYMKRYDPGYRYAQSVVREMSGIRYIQINTLHPSEDQYHAIHPLVRTRDVPTSVLQPLLDAQDALLIEAVGPISDALRFVYYDVVLGSMVHDINALRGLVGEPEGVSFTEVWPEGDRAPSITTILRYPGNMRAVYTWTYLADLRDYFEEIALMSSPNRVRIQFPSPFLKHFPTPVVIQGMDNGAAYEKRVLASYDEAFKEELRAFHDCVVNGRPPLTDARDGKRDIAILQQIVAAARPAGLGGEAAQAFHSERQLT